VLTHRVEPTLATGRAPAAYTTSRRRSARWPASGTSRTPRSPERFEAYLGPIELANGYHELADAEEQGLRFASDVLQRRDRCVLEPPVDSNLLDALRSGLPDCAGVALGVDRLLMAMMGTNDIADVLAFPFQRA
jgi:lysyl-tRNA synthetase class 2